MSVVWIVDRSINQAFPFLFLPVKLKADLFFSWIRYNCICFFGMIAPIGPARQGWGEGGGNSFGRGTRICWYITYLLCLLSMGWLSSLPPWILNINLASFLFDFFPIIFLICYLMIFLASVMKWQSVFYSALGKFILSFFLVYLFLFIKNDALSTEQSRPWESDKSFAVVLYQLLELIWF